MIAGSLYSRDGAIYNALYFFAPDGGVAVLPQTPTRPVRRVVSRTRVSLVAAVLSERSAAASRAATSTASIRITALRVAPLICWESAFSDLASSKCATARNSSS